MQESYSDKAVFNDPVFINLDANHVRAMWEMFCVNGKDLTIKYSDVKANDTDGEAIWVANYIFSATGNKVENVISAKFKFENGKIVNHQDTFDFYNWASQSLGMMGKLMGWTPLVKSKIQNAGMKNLEAFMSHEE